MSPKSLSILAVAALAVTLVHVPVTHAFNFGNMMNPSRWMGGDRDRDDDYPPGGAYGPPGYGYPYGGYGAPYGVPGYGAPFPGYAPPPAYPAPAAAAPAAPPSAGTADSAEVQALKRRVEELEAQQRGASAPPPAGDWPSQPAPPPSSDWPSAPAFRPMNQY